MALPPLLAGVRAALELADTRTAALVAEVLDTALAEVDARPDDPDRLTAHLLEARLARMRGALPAARAKIAPVLAAATAGALAAEAWLERGRVEWNTGDALAAKDALGRAWQLAVAAGAARLAADARRIHGLVELHGGALAAAEGHFEAARRTYAELGERVRAASCGMNLGVAARQAGEAARAAEHVVAARALHAEAGARWGVAECENELGELARLAGDWAGAAAHYETARALNDALGSGDAVFNELNLALVRLETGDLEAARTGLSRGRAVLEAQGRLAVSHAVRVLERVAEALEPDVVESVTRPRAEEAARALAACGFVDADVARWAGRARDHANQRGAAGLADVFDRIHRSQQNALTGGSPS
jgi:tetratricopeptide (TPR) repeat protein